MKRFTLQLALAFAASVLTLSASTISASLPEFNGGFHKCGFPQPAITIGTFTYTIPDGEHIVSASLHSTFGNSSFPNSAGVDLFADGIATASCAAWGLCDTGSSPAPFSHAFAPSDFALLSNGSLPVTAVQTSGNIIRLGQETLCIHTASNGPADAPEPATAALLGLGATALWLMRRVPR